MEPIFPKEMAKRKVGEARLVVFCRVLACQALTALSRMFCSAVAACLVQTHLLSAAESSLQQEFPGLILF